MKADDTLDCYGLLCPMPIIKAAKKIRELKIGEILEIQATDEGIKEGIPVWCRQTGQEYPRANKSMISLKLILEKSAIDI